VLARDFVAGKPNEKWATDITYIWTAEGWLCLAVMMDLYSRRIIGWSTSEHMETSLCFDALSIAIKSRTNVKGTTHHSDRGVQYASREYRRRLKSKGIECSMSRRGNCWDSEIMQSRRVSLERSRTS
jgi:putative transposase